MGSASAEIADKHEDVQCRGAFDKGDLKEAAGRADAEATASPRLASVALRHDG
jgi:hypothetical protein